MRHVWPGLLLALDWNLKDGTGRNSVLLASDAVAQVISHACDYRCDSACDIVKIPSVHTISASRNPYTFLTPMNQP